MHADGNGNYTENQCALMVSSILIVANSVCCCTLSYKTTVSSRNSLHFSCSLRSPG